MGGELQESGFSYLNPIHLAICYTSSCPPEYDCRQPIETFVSFIYLEVWCCTGVFRCLPSWPHQPPGMPFIRPWWKHHIKPWPASTRPSWFLRDIFSPLAPYVEWEFSLWRYLIGASVLTSRLNSQCNPGRVYTISPPSPWHIILRI